MSKSSTDKLTLADILILLAALFVVVSSVVYVMLYKQRQESDNISVSFFDYSKSYDVSVINSADIDDFMQISGIGEVKASAIITYRDSLGGLSDVYQLLDLPIVTPKVFEDILAHFYLDDSDSSKSENIDEENILIDDSLDSEDLDSADKIDEAPLRRVNINTASAVEIAECLLLSDVQAQQIVEIRNIIGHYNSLDELALCNLISEETVSQIKDYILL